MGNIQKDQSDQPIFTEAKLKYSRAIGFGEYLHHFWATEVKTK